MSEKINEVQSRREWEQAVKAFDVVFIPLKNQALVSFIERILDYLEEQNFDPSSIVSVVCSSYLDIGNPDAETLNQSTVEALKQLVASYENSIELEE
jgi:hypothetical protein